MLQFQHKVRPAFIGAILALAVATANSANAPANSAAIRQISSRHLTLFTDLPPNSDVDALPELFDQAFPQWCAYFGVDEKKHADWRMRGYLMRAREHFAAAGMLPAGLPNFLNGYARGDQLWLYDQTSAYYRRHLLLHEGTHAFMNRLAYGDGPTWFSEGMAELLATHKLEDGRLTLHYFPRSRSEVPKWGRIEIVQSEFAAGRALSLEKVFALRQFIENEPYGWCWAAAAFFDFHPRYQSRFRALQPLAGKQEFGAEFRKAFAADWERLNEDWRLFVGDLDYDYDFVRDDVNFVAGRPMKSPSASVTVAADRGWQSSGVQVAAGQTYRLRARGRYQVAAEPRPWWCEPGGVTIRYYRGRPLGMLLAAVRTDDANPHGSNGLLKPMVVGLEATLKPEQTGTLYFRTNDSAGSLADNEGSLEVEISRE